MDSYVSAPFLTTWGKGYIVVTVSLFWMFMWIGKKL